MHYLAKEREREREREDIRRPSLLHQTHPTSRWAERERRERSERERKVKRTVTAGAAAQSNSHGHLASLRKRERKVPHALALKPVTPCVASASTVAAVVV